MKIEKIKENYESGKLPLGAVRVLVRFRILTNDQFREITGKEFSEFAKTL